MRKLRGGATAPEAPIPLLPLRAGVLFPGTVITLPVGRERSVALLQSLHPGAILAVVPQRDAAVADPGEDDLHTTGTFARLQRLARLEGGEYRVVLEGLQRFSASRLLERRPFWTADGTAVDDEVSDESEARLLARALQEHLAETAGRGGLTVEKTGSAEDDPGLFADQVAAALSLPTDKELQVLRTVEVVARLKLVTSFVAEARAVSDVKRKIDEGVRSEFGKHQREAVLREQLKAIKKELGDDKGDELQGLKDRLDKAGLSEEARAVADRELGRLEGMPSQAAEHHVIRTYLEWIAELPWSLRAGAPEGNPGTETGSAVDELDAVAKRLDADHAGLADVKKRILEHMAVLKLSGRTQREGNGTLLCLVGPPGVGKTSLGQSIADAMGRPFVRVALGGVRDEAEVRGHRRTYVGALPGRILHAMKKAKAKNPVLLLDEIDKLGSGWAGSPEAALLEVLDPEQNKTFVDHYLEIPFDLSEVIFLCTANTLETLSPPLRDRLEVIELQGYTADEKVQIARSHLLPKQRKHHALGEDALRVTDGALLAIVRDYTREAGVRQLERQLTKLCRAVALQVARKADEKAPQLTLDEEGLVAMLGRPKFFADVAERTAVPGVATGLAWTPVGGDILFVETSRMPGKGSLEITGQLGDVMKESARAALTYVRSNAAHLGVDPRFLEGQDVHLHVPAGGVPKDGPSAGVTIFTALTSLLTGRKVRSDTAMTGEVTLRGRVLPVGGIKAKVLAAHRAGITRVILPKKNERDVEDIPAEVRGALEILFAEDMSQVLDVALEGTPAAPTPGITTPGVHGAPPDLGSLSPA